MKSMKKFMALALALVMVFALSANAFAATSSPNMTAYDTAYSYSFNAGTAATQTLKAATATAGYTVSGFSSEADAKAVRWSVVGGSTSGVTLERATGAVEITDGNGIGTGLWASTKKVIISDSAAPGVASIEAKNTTTGATMNFSIVVNGTAEAKTNITYQFYDVDSTGLETSILTVSNMTVADNDYYANSTYPSVLDGIYKTWYNTLNATDRLSSYTVNNSWGSYYVESLTFIRNGQTSTYEETMDEDYNYIGWQYRVYRNGVMLPLSEFVDADDFALQNGDTVVWKYGIYGVVSFS